MGPTLVGLLAYGLILLMNLSLEAAEMAIRRDLPLDLVLRFLVLSLPRILVLTIPMAVLVGVLVGVGRLAADGEIAALRSLGYNERRLVVSALLLGAASAAATWALFDMAVPAANYAQHQLQARIFLSSDLNREIQPRAFFEKIPNLLIYADGAQPEDGTLERVLLYQKDAQGAEEISTADRARIEYQEGRGALSFRLQGVVSHAWDRANPDAYQVANRQEETIVRPPDLFTTEMIRSLKEPPPPNLREQSVSQLRETLREFRKLPRGGGRQRLMNEARVEIHKKFAIPATCLVFAALGLSIALAQRRGGRAWGFLISLLLIAIQYFFLTAGEQLADRGRLSPGVAMWMGNAVFAAIAFVLLAAGGRWTWDPIGIRERLMKTRPRRAASPPPAPGPPALSPSSPESIERAAATSGRDTALPREGLPRRAAWWHWVPTVDLYLLSALISVAVLVILSLTLLFALSATLNLLDEMTRGHHPASLLLQYVASVLPQFLTLYIVPVGLCVATLITFALLSRTHELTALRSAGVGPFRVSAVFLSVALVAAAFSFGALDSVLPATNQKAVQIRDQIRGRSPRSYRQPERRWVFGSRGDLVTFSDFSHERLEILDLASLRFEPRSFLIRERIYAERAVWTSEGWLLSKGWRREFTPTGETYQPFARRLLQDMDPPDYFVQEWRAPDQMNFGELRAYVADMERRGYETRDLRVGLYRKTAVPAVCVVMVVIALAFALRVERRGALYGLGVALLLVTVYFFAMQASSKLGEVGVLPPLLAAWAPNLLFSGSGLYLMASSRW